MVRELWWNEPNLAPTDVKRQHYVPRLHLNRFVGRDGKLRVLDLDNKSEYRTSTINAALETGFNNLVVGGQNLSTEDWLARLEGEAAPVIGALVEDPDAVIALNTEQEMAFARFLVALRLRTPAFRDWFGPHSASMLEEVRGLANVLRGMSWRCGRSTESLGLYTSDNPMAGFLPAVRPRLDHGAFATLTYFIPLSPVVLLQIKPWPRMEDSRSDVEPQGGRRRSDFSVWEVSFARHVVTGDATRFLYGEGPLVSKACAFECLSRIDRFNRDYAVQFQGFEANPPKMPDFETYMAQAGDDEWAPGYPKEPS